MCSLGEHPVTGPLLAAAAADRPFLEALACSRGVHQQDVRDVIQDAYVTVFSLQIRAELQDRLDAFRTPAEDPAEIPRIIAALLVVYVKFSCGTYIRKLKRDGRELPAVAPTPVTEAIHELLVNLFPNGDVDAVMRGEPGALERVCELLYDGAALTAAERRYARFKANNPEGQEKDFASLPAYAITRTKQSAMRKIRYFLATGQVWERKAGG